MKVLTQWYGQDAPKVYVTKSTFEMAIHSAVMHFNDGTKRAMNVLSSFGIAGKVTCAKSRLHNINRVKQMNKKSSKPVKKRRKINCILIIVYLFLRFWYNIDAYFTQNIFSFRRLPSRHKNCSVTSHHLRVNKRKFS